MKLWLNHYQGENIENSFRLDASQMFKALETAAKLFDAYTNAVKAAGAGGKEFNAAQKQVEKALQDVANAAKDSAKQVERAADAEAKAASKAEAAAERRRRAAAQERSRAAANAANARRAVEASIGPGLRERATLGEIVNFDRALNQFQKFAQANRVTGAQVKKILGNLRAQYRGTEAEIRDSIVRIINAQSALGRTNFRATQKVLKQVGTSGQKATQQITEGAKKATRSTNELTLSWRSILRLFTSQIVGRAFTFLISQLRESVDAARELETALAEIQTISVTLRDFRIGDIQEITSGISGDFGIPQLEVAKGLYQALSNQVGDTADTLAFLRKSAEFSKATVSELSEAVDLLSGSLNAYDLRQENTTELADKLQKTIELGRVRASDLAETFGRVTPLAAQVGVSFTELNSAIATLTRQGIKPEEALTQIRALIQKMIQPTDALKAAFDELGISSAKAGFQTFGFLGFLQELESTTQGTTKEIGEFFSRVRALSGQFGLTTRDGKLFAETQEEIAKALETSSEAAQIVLQTQAQQFERNIQKFQNTLTQDFGRTVISAFNKFVDAVGGAENAAKVFLNTVVTLGTVTTTIVGVQLADAFLKMAGRIALAEAQLEVMTATALRLRGLKILGGLAAIIVSFKVLSEVTDFSSDNLEEHNEALEKLQRQSERTARQIEQDARRQSASVIKNMQEQTKVVLESLAQQQKAFNDTRKTAELSFGVSTNLLQRQLDARLEAVRNFRQELEDAQKNAAERTREINKEFRDFVFEARKFKVQSLFGDIQSDAGKIRFLKKEFDRLLEAFQRASRTGKLDFAETLKAEAFDVAKQLDELRKNFADPFRGRFSSVDRLLEITQKLNKEQERLRESTAADAAAAAPGVAAAEARIEFNINKLSELLERLGKFDVTPTEFENIRQEFQRVSGLLENDFKIVGRVAAQGFVQQFEGAQSTFDILASRFRSAITGKPVTLKFAADEAIQDLRQRLEQVTLDVNVRLKLEEFRGQELPVGGEAIGVAQEEVANLNLEIEKLQKNLVKLRTTESAVSFEQDKIVQSILDLQKEIRETGAVGTNTVIGQLLQSIGAEIGPQTKAARFLNKQFQKLGNSIDKAVSEGDVERLRELALTVKDVQLALSARESTLFDPETALEELKDVSKSLEVIIEKQQQLEGLRQKQTELQQKQQLLNQLIQSIEKQSTIPGVSNQMKQLESDTNKANAAAKRLIENLRKSAEEQEKGVGAGQFSVSDDIPDNFEKTTRRADGSNKAIKSFDNTVSRFNQTVSTTGPIMRGLNDGFRELEQIASNFGSTTSQASDTIVNSLSRASSSFDSTNSSAKRLLTTINDLNASGGTSSTITQGKSRGGLVRRFAEGGFVPRGTDTVPAMLTPGEFVVNAQSSRKFFSELVAINSGRQPVFRQEGGPVTNNTFGDIVLNVDAPGGVVNGREAAQQIRRELRRKTSRLN